MKHQGRSFGLIILHSDRAVCLGDRWEPSDVGLIWITWGTERMWRVVLGQPGPRLSMPGSAKARALQCASWKHSVTAQILSSCSGWTGVKGASQAPQEPCRPRHACPQPAGSGPRGELWWGDVGTSSCSCPSQVLSVLRPPPGSLCLRLRSLW